MTNTLSFTDIKSSLMLEQLFKFACSEDEEIKVLQQKYIEARISFDSNPTTDNATKMLNALTNIHVRETVIKYDIIHRQHQRFPSHFLKEERHT